MSEEVKKVSHKNLIIGVIVVVMITIVLFVPMIPVEVTYSETEPSEETETYTESESYEREATYIVDDWNLEEKLGFLDFYVQSDVTVRNTDKDGGTFEVVHDLFKDCPKGPLIDSLNTLTNLTHVIFPFIHNTMSLV